MTAEGFWASKRMLLSTFFPILEIQTALELQPSHAVKILPHANITVRATWQLANGEWVGTETINNDC